MSGWGCLRLALDKPLWYQGWGLITLWSNMAMEHISFIDEFHSYKPPFSSGISWPHVWLPEGKSIKKSIITPLSSTIIPLKFLKPYIYNYIYIWSTIKFPLLVMTSYHLITIKSHKIPIFWWLNRSIHHFHRLSLWQAERSSFTEEETLVSFAEMKDEELKAYIETGEPFDKAGGYGIQVRRVAAGDAQQELRFKQEWCPTP